MDHYHLTRNGQKTPERLPSEADARQALARAADELVAEKSNQGAGATAEPLNGGTLVRWSHDGPAGRWRRGRREYLSGWQVLEIAQCGAEDCLEARPAGLMTVRAEVWPMSADDAGIWLVSGAGPWRSADVLASQDEFAVVEGILAEHGARGAAVIIHGTSWRSVDTYAVHSWGVLLSCPDVHGHWPGSLPISRELLERVGNPAPHAPDGPPLPRDIDVAFHALGHFSHLLKTAAPERAKMSPQWRRHLREWEPALAGLYSAPYVAAEAS